MPTKKRTSQRKSRTKSAHRNLKPWPKLTNSARIWWTKSIFHKVVAVFFAILILSVSGMYAVAQWYIASKSDEQMKVGVTFIPRYARYFGLDAEETMQAMIDDLGVRQFRLVSYWDNHEHERDKYDFSDLDWQFKKAEESGSKVSLALGLRQPRWPECHMPDWAEYMTVPEWSAELKEYMGAVIDRYKDSPALESYQLENEFFLKVFGICPDHSRERLVDEYEFVKHRDPTHPVIVSRSNNAVGFPVNKPQPDEFAVSIYKRVWDKTVTKRYFEYPFPAWFYAFLAGGGQILTGKDMIIHELQAEPWVPEGYSLNTTSIEEQNKSMNAERLKDRFEYGRATGMKEMYLWGAEWWYWRKVKLNEPTVWDTARESIRQLHAGEHVR